MTIFIRVFLRGYTIVFALVFALFFIVLFPFQLLFLLLNRKWAHDIAHRMNTLWGLVISAPFGIWIKRINSKALKKGQAYVFVPNHNSYFDIPICNIGIPHPFRFMGKAELNKIPLFGYMFKTLHIPVNRESKMDAFRSFVHSGKKLEEGTSMLIFPEATIPDKKKVVLGTFKDGAFRLAIKYGVPVVPVSIVGGDKVLPDDRKWLLRPGRVKVFIESPIPTSGLTAKDAPALLDQTYNIIYQRLIQNGYGNIG